MLAAINMALVYAGNASRGTGRFVLEAGCPARWMPLVVGVTAWAPAVCLLIVTDRLPRPDPADVAARTARRPMGGEARRARLPRSSPL